MGLGFTEEAFNHVPGISLAKAWESGQHKDGLDLGKNSLVMQN